MGTAASIFLGVVPAVLYAWMIYWLDRYEKEPLLLVGGVFLWGAIVAAGGAFVLNTVFGMGVYYLTESDVATNIATSSISAPLVEESLKGFAVLIVFFIFRKEFDNLLDGVVYAGVAALGFAATENSLYIYRGFQSDGVGGLITLSLIRNVLVGWQHPFYTSFIGIGLALSRINRSTLIKFAAPLIGWGIAVFTHSLHNTIATFIGSFSRMILVSMVEWTGWLFMFLLIVWFNLRERNFIRRYLREEVAFGRITEKQYSTMTTFMALSMARFNALTSGKYRSTKRFYQLCFELAHKKRQYTELGELSAMPIIEKLREDLAVLSPQALA